MNKNNMKQYIPSNLLKIFSQIKWKTKNFFLGLQYPRKKLDFTEETIDSLKKQYGKLTEFKIKEITSTHKNIKYSPSVKTIGDEILTIPSISNNTIKIYLADSKDSRFSFRNNFFITSDLGIIFYQSVSFKEVCDLAEGALEKPKKIKGTVAYLCNSKGPNIFHWVFYALSLNYCYQQCGLGDEIDYYY